MQSFDGLCFKISLISDNILLKYYEWASFRDYFFISLTGAACSKVRSNVSQLLCCFTPQGLSENCSITFYFEHSELLEMFD